MKKPHSKNNLERNSKYIPMSRIFLTASSEKIIRKPSEEKANIE